MLAYTGQGVYKSVHATHHAKTKNLIIDRKHEEGEYMLKHATEGQFSNEAIIKKYDQLRMGIDEDYV